MRDNQRIKVLLLLHQLSIGGAPKVAIDALETLRDKLDVRVVSAGGGVWESRVRKLFPLFVYRPGNSRLQRLFYWLIRPVRSWIWSFNVRRWKPDVIYINSVSSLLLPKVLKMPDAPVMLHVHETGLLLDKIGSPHREALRELPRKYIAVTENVGDALGHQFGVSRARVSVVNNFLAQSCSRSVEQRPQRETLVLGGVGLLGWIKGYELWLMMAHELIKLMPDRRIRFVWVGVREDEHGRQFRAMAEKLGLTDRVDFVEPQADLDSHYASFDVTAVTSWEESFSLVALESMSHGVPVACFAGSGGTPEVVGDAGLVISEFSPGLMAEAIAGLVSSPESLRAMSEAAKKRAFENFSADRQIAKIYEELRILASGDCDCPK